MDASIIGFAIEALVSVLLLVTIVYCVSLNRKLERLRSDESDMKALVEDIIDATGKAEQALQTLKGSADDWDRALGARLRQADKSDGALQERIDAAEHLVERLAQICEAGTPARRHETSAQRDQARMTAAAQALAAALGPDTETPAKEQAQRDPTMPATIGPRPRKAIRLNRADAMQAGQAA